MGRYLAIGVKLQTAVRKEEICLVKLSIELEATGMCV